MIVKYFNNGEWGYIDNILITTQRDYSYQTLLETFADEIKSGKRVVMEINDSTAEAEALFQSGFSLSADKNEPRRTIPLKAINHLKVHETEVITVVKAINDDTQFIVITNQDTYLLNDKGQTIERLA